MWASDDVHRLDRVWRAYTFCTVIGMMKSKNRSVLCVCISTCYAGVLLWKWIESDSVEPRVCRFIGSTAHRTICATLTWIFLRFFCTRMCTLWLNKPKIHVFRKLFFISHNTCFGSDCEMDLTVAGEITFFALRKKSGIRIRFTEHIRNFRCDFVRTSNPREICSIIRYDKMWRIIARRAWSSSSVWWWLLYCNSNAELWMHFEGN